MKDDGRNEERIGDLVFLDAFEEQGVDEFREDDDGDADCCRIVDEPMLRDDKLRLPLHCTQKSRT